MLIHLETAAGVALNHGVHGEKDPLITNYERLVELYVIHVLAKLNEWDYAAELLQYNSVLSDQTKKVYTFFGCQSGNGLKLMSPDTGLLTRVMNCP
jgi:hypothetical protein